MHRELMICVTFLSLSLSPPPSLLSSHVCVSLKIIEKLLSECDAQRLQLITDSYLNLLHSMLESSNTDFQIMATDSVRRQTAKHMLEILLNFLPHPPPPPPLSLSLSPSPLPLSLSLLSSLSGRSRPRLTTASTTSSSTDLPQWLWSRTWTALTPFSSEGERERSLPLHSAEVADSDVIVSLSSCLQNS